MAEIRITKSLIVDIANLTKYRQSCFHNLLSDEIFTTAVISQSKIQAIQGTGWPVSSRFGPLQRTFQSRATNIGETKHDVDITHIGESEHFYLQISSPLNDLHFLVMKV